MREEGAGEGRRGWPVTKQGTTTACLLLLLTVVQNATTRTWAAVKANEKNYFSFVISLEKYSAIFTWRMPHPRPLIVAK